MTIPVKLAIAVIGGGSLAAGGYGTYELIRPKNILQKLKWEGFSPLDVGDGTVDGDSWAKLYTEYSKGDNENNKFKNSEPTISNSNNLKTNCKRVFGLSLKEQEDNLTKAKLWCIKESEKLKS